MDQDQLLDLFVRSVKRDLVIDLIDRVPQEAFRAFEMVKTQSGLVGRPARELTGQARFRMMERGFVEENIKNGGLRLDGDVLPGIGLQVFQPFFIHGAGDQRIVLGLATISEPAKLPTQNQSRLAAVQLNYHVLPTLDFDGTSPKPGDVFVLFLVARDPEHGGMIKELALGVVDASYQQYILYVTVEKLLSHYSKPAPTSSGPSSGGSSPADGGVTLKKQPKKFGDAEKGNETSHRDGRKQ
jgi:hypothetical protein